MKNTIALLIVFSYIISIKAQDSVALSAIKEFPVLWQQKAAEYRALCYQAFNLAKWRVDQASPRKIKKQHYVIITDLDETILDNSFQAAQLILEGKEYSSAEWKKWSSLSKAGAVPGAVEFLNYAHSKGITIYYISNRAISELGSTLADLKRWNLPNADSLHCLFRQETSSKESRRNQVKKEHEVFLLLGDNLNDFSNAFEDKSIEDRFRSTDSTQEVWGKKFIVLPNASYGDWEAALYSYQKTLTPLQKEAIRRSLLVGFSN